MPDPAYSFNGCRFDESDGRLWGADAAQPVTLRPQAARLLVAFLDRPGEVLNRKHLRSAVWDEGAVVDFESGLAALMRELRQALDEVGAGAHLIETVPRRGYRFLGTVDEDKADSVNSDPLPIPDPPRASRTGLALLAVGLLALVLVGTVLWWVIADNGAEPLDNPTLAIMPFQVYSDDDRASRRLRLLLADSLLARLWQVELADLDLIGRAALRPYQDREDQAAAVAADLGVSLLLEGSIIRPADYRWQVDARLLAMPRGTVLWSTTVRGRPRFVGHAELPVAPTVDDLIADLARAGRRSDQRHAAPRQTQSGARMNIKSTFIIGCRLRLRGSIRSTTHPSTTIRCQPPVSGTLGKPNQAVRGALRGNQRRFIWLLDQGVVRQTTTHTGAESQPHLPGAASINPRYSVIMLHVSISAGIAAPRHRSSAAPIRRVAVLQSSNSMMILPNGMRSTSAALKSGPKPVPRVTTTSPDSSTWPSITAVPISHTCSPSR